MRQTYNQSFACQEAMVAIGKNLKLARLRRNETAESVASRLGISRRRYAAIENGDPSVSAGALIDALLIFGFDTQLFNLANPEHDTIGQRLAQTTTKQRARQHGKSKPKDD